MHRMSGRSVSGRMSTTPHIEPMMRKISSVGGAGRHAAVAYLSHLNAEGFAHPGVCVHLRE